MCAECPFPNNRMDPSGCKIFHPPLAQVIMVYYHPRHGHQTMALPRDRMPGIRGKTLASFITETSQCIYVYLAHPLRVTARPLRGIVSCSRSLCLMHLFVLVSCPLPIETTLFICHFNCPIFNVFCCVGHCIISLCCPLSMTSRTCFCSHDSRYIDSILHKPSGLHSFSGGGNT
jgi:hypothetical protein